MLGSYGLIVLNIYLKVSTFQSEGGNDFGGKLDFNHNGTPGRHFLILGFSSQCCGDFGSLAVLFQALDSK